MAGTPLLLDMLINITLFLSQLGTLEFAILFLSYGYFKKQSGKTNNIFFQGWINL